MQTALDRITWHFGWSAKVPNQTVIDKLPHAFQTKIDRGITTVHLRRDYYKQIEVDPPPILTDLPKFARKIAKDLHAPTYCTEVLDRAHYVRVGVRVFIPDKKETFITYALIDKHADILFPKYGVKSDAPTSAVLGMVNVDLPSSPDELFGALDTHSFELCGQEHPTRELRISLLTRLVYASFNYPTIMIWKGKDVPTDIFNELPQTVNIRGSPSVMPLLSNADIAQMVRRTLPRTARSPVIPEAILKDGEPREYDSSDVVLDPEHKTKLVTDLRNKYGLSPDHLRKLLTLLGELIYQSDKSAELHTIHQLFAALQSSVTVGKVKITIDPKRRIMVEYTPENDEKSVT